MKLSSNAKNLSLAAATLLALAMPRPSQAQIAYTVTDLGRFGATAINNLGQVAGYYWPGNGGSQVAAIYSDGTITTLTNEISVAYGINDAGQVVGSTVRHSNGFRYSNAFLYDKGSLTLLDAPGGFTSAKAINNRGDIIGISRYYNPFILDSEGNVHRIPAGPFGINDLGQVTGTTGDHAFIYSDGVLRDIGNPPGGYQTFGIGINDYGDVAGYSFTRNGYDFPSSGQHAFVYHDGTMADIGTLPGDNWSFANDINNLGEVIGTSQYIDPAGGISTRIRAFLFENGSMHDLNDLIPPDSGLTLQFAQAINEHGQIVASGDGHSFLLTPLSGGVGVEPSAVPEPTTLAFLAGLAVPGIALALRGRRNRLQ